MHDRSNLNSVSAGGLATLATLATQMDQGLPRCIVTRQPRRAQVLRGWLEAITTGRQMPDLEEISIGSARRFEALAVLFLNIYEFSNRQAERYQTLQHQAQRRAWQSKPSVTVAAESLLWEGAQAAAHTMQRALAKDKALPAHPDDRHTTHNEP